ncbi:fibronectin type III domain-containing protein [Aquipuribacter nitratireducens]|uniref:Fibronectin type-III domain-containing protein n=1 Tax=Aquipuribacter nitratireducens TaxID=650104 RepID=A0ABW0GI74_9MICO
MAAVPRRPLLRGTRARRAVGALLVALLVGVTLTASTPATDAVAATGHRAVHVAGGGVGDDGPGTDALTRPGSSTVVRLPRGEIGWYDFASHQIRVRTPDGTVSDVFGNGRRGDSDLLSGFAGVHARDAALPSPAAMWATPDGALWLDVTSRMVRIDPVTHLMSVHYVPQVNGGTQPLLVRRDGSLVVHLNDASAPRVALLEPGWTPTSPFTTLVARQGGHFAEAPDGTLYEAYGAGVYRHRPGSSPVLVAGTTGAWPAGEDRPDGPALGASMQPLGIDVDATGRIALLDLSPRDVLRVRVVSGPAGGATLRTVSPTWRGGDRTGCSNRPRPLWESGRVLVACQWSIRAFRPDGSDAGSPGAVVVGRGEDATTQQGSPTGTEAHRAYLPGSAHDLQLAMYGEVGIVSTVDARIVHRDNITSTRRVVVTATAADAAGGLGWPSTVWWRASFAVPGDVVGLVCRDHETCVVRRRDSTGTWSTVPWPDAATRPAARVWEYDRATKRVYFTIGDGPLEVLDLATSTFSTVAGLSSVPERVAPLRDGRLLLAVPGATTATLFDPTSGQESPTQLPVGLDWAPQQLLTHPADWVWVSTGDTLRLYTLQGQFSEIDPAVGRAARRVEGTVDPFPGAIYADPSGEVLSLSNLLHDVTVHRYTLRAERPAAPPAVRVVPGDGRVTVSWNAPDARGSEISGYVVRDRDGRRTTEVPATQRSIVLQAPNDVAAHYTVTALSDRGRGDPSLRSAWAVPRDTVPPGPVTFGTTGYAVGSVTLRWTLPADPDLAGVIVTRRTGLSRPGCTEAPGTTVVYRGTGTSTRQRVKPGASYSFTVCTRDRLGNTSSGQLVQFRGTRSSVSTSVDGAAVTAITYGTSQTVVHTARLQLGDGSPVNGVAVSLQSRAKGSSGTWSTVATATTVSGQARLVHRPSAGTEYRVLFPGGAGRHGSVSAARVLDVRAAVTATASATSAPRGSTVTIGGRVAPDHAGRTVRLQTRTSSGWSTVAEQKLSSASAYRFTVSRSRSSSATTLTYRVVAVPKPGYVTGTSASRTVRWT